jgi:hypothetical protein
LLSLSLFLVLLPLLELIKQLQLLLFLEVLLLYDPHLLLLGSHFDLLLLSLKAVFDLPHLFLVLDTHYLLDLDDLLAQDTMLLHDL